MAVDLLAVGDATALVAGTGVEDAGRKSWRYSISSERSFRRCSSFDFSASSVFFWVT